MQKIIFENNANEFLHTLKKRVNAYFISNRKIKYASGKTYCKMFLMISLFVIPYLLLLFISISSLCALFFCLVMGIAMAGIGFCVSHPAAHDAVSKNKIINRIFSLSFNLVGMSDYIWKIKHNVFHHTYTNVYEKDEALKEGDAMRLSYDAPHKYIHRYQHLYGVLVYGFFTIFWAFFLDMEKLIRYNANGKRKKEKHPLTEVILFWVTKVYYIFFAFLLPHYVAGFSWISIFIVFFVMHFTASLIITHVLQVEHLAEEITLVKTEINGVIKKSWAENQLEGTCNFKANNRIFNWYISACNYQIEHHLFPQISPEHYPALSKIIKKTASEFDLKYNLQPSFRTALVSHYKMLKNLGGKPENIPVTI